ncbi:MAG: response regulator, partial [Myxococcales bacterium]|nr:response regulator [Myxococcales bacterium]
MAQTDNSEIKILVVDDEASARSALSELLRDEGYAVHTAGDGFKALGQLEEWAPDLMLTDVQMPGMSGIELMEKARERVPGVGVVVMTAFGSVENAVTAMQAGADDYLTKPVHFPELLLVVERLLERQALRRENERLRDALQGSAADEVGWVGSSK